MSIWTITILGLAGVFEAHLLQWFGLPEINAWGIAIMVTVLVCHHNEKEVRE